LALGFFAAHWLPHWSSISDPVWEIKSLRWISYLASIAEILGALGLALAGLAVIRADTWHSTHRRATAGVDAPATG
jgi:hypothetical protein